MTYLVIMPYLGHKNGRNSSPYPKGIGVSFLQKYEKIAILPHLKNKNVTSCGCRKKGKNNIKWMGVGDLGLTVWNQFVSGAIKRNYPFEITIEYGWNMYLEQNKKCALSGQFIEFSTVRRKNTASLDRIDSNKGYIKGNVQWVHKNVNIAKRSQSDLEFIKMCQAVSAYRS